MLDGAGTFFRWNTSFERLCGYSGEEIQRLSLLDLFVASDRELMRLSIDKALAEGEAHAEVELVAKNGRRTPCFLTGRAVQNEGERWLIGMGMDISGQRLLEEQLRQSQKMEAVGALAKGVAHDFNNIMMAIMNYAGLIQLHAREDERITGLAESIIQAGNRAANLTKSLQAFSSKQPADMKPIDLNEILGGFYRTIGRFIGEDVVFTLLLCSESLPVEGDAGQLEQVLINLTSNSRDAMPSGGKLSITTDRIDIAAAQAGPLGVGVPGPYALITIADEGVGMDKHTRERAFEPFFSTKDVGKGTGLGLSTAYGIIRKHNGYITLSSDPGSGTTFRIFLPLIKPKTERETARPARQGCETVLLVEDEEALRLVTRELLEKFGYRVIEAEDGESALSIFRGAVDPIDLLLSDVVMPKMGGLDLYREILNIKKGLPVIFMSGYPNEYHALNGGEIERFLAKPLKPTELLATIDEVMVAAAESVSAVHS